MWILTSNSLYNADSFTRISIDQDVEITGYNDVPSHYLKECFVEYNTSEQARFVLLRIHYAIKKGRKEFVIPSPQNVQHNIEKYRAKMQQEGLSEDLSLRGMEIFLNSIGE